MRVLQGHAAILAATLGIMTFALAGCNKTAEGSRRDRPPEKPVQIATLFETESGALPATVSTRTGEILVRDLEGRVQRLPLDSAGGRTALAESEARIADAATAKGAEPAMSAQQKIEAQFEDQRRPALPPGVEGSELPDPSIFIGARVVELRPGQTPQIAGRPVPRPHPVDSDMRLAEVTVNLKQGVDVDTAFAYATCALAGWAMENGVPYARHIRTLQQRAKRRLRVASVFTLSEQPPMGLSVVEAGPTLAECKARGIPAT